MGEATHDGLVVPGRVVLAHEPPFSIGRLRVAPALLQLEFEGARETLEPRVMQVLVLLARAGGAIVTRDELIERCWDGRIVSDNAVNRVLSKVRRIGSQFGTSFQIETITKVGYRLTRPDEHAARTPSSGSNDAALSAVDRRSMLAGATTVIIAAAGGIMGWRGGSDPARAEAEILVRKGLELSPYGLPNAEEQVAAYFREAVKVDPGYADAWGYLSNYEGDPGRQRSAALRALELDLNNVAARRTLLWLGARFGNWDGFEAGCRKLLRQSSAKPFEKSLRIDLANLHCDVGRWRDALVAWMALNETDPYQPHVHYRLINALWAAGRTQDAENALEKAVALWPREQSLWTTKLRLLTFGGRADETLPAFDDTASYPPDMDTDILDASRGTAKALASATRIDLEAAVAANLKAARTHPDSAYAWALNLAALGHVDEAFSLAEGYYLGTGSWSALLPPPAQRNYRGTMFLFYPPTAAMRADPRFDRLVQDIGLQRYWRKVGVQPDYRRFA